jgi:hypothetical protein
MSTINYNLILDVSNIFYRSYSVYKNNITGFDLKNQDHKNMLIRKFIVDVCSFSNKIPTMNLFFCFDSQPFRKQVDVNYKANRINDGSKDDFYATIDELKRLLEFKNLNALKVEGLEADDLTALVAKKLKHLPNVIISADQDVRQLVKSRVYVLNPLKQHTKIFHCLYSAVTGKKDFQDLGFETEQIWAHYILAEKILKGCDGDNVPSLVPKGFRTKKIEEIADKYLRYKVDNDKVTDVEAWLHSINSVTDLNLSYDNLYRQMQLVCLEEQYMPTQCIQEFNQIKLINQRPINLTMESILSNTVYYNEKFKK